MTTPPTTTETDTYVAANWDTILSEATDQGDKNSFIKASGYTDTIWWMVAYTDNSATKHYEGLGFYPSGVVGAADADLEASTPVNDSYIPFVENGGTAGFNALAYVHALIAAYGSVLLRGYLIPGVPWPPAPVDSTVQTWVNDQGNWSAAG